MQMIADGKIKDGKIITRHCSTGDIVNYIFEDNEIKLLDAIKPNIFNVLGLITILTSDFEILEDKTEEIRLGVDDSNMEYVEFKNGGCTTSGYTKSYSKLDIMFFKRIKKLEEILNKQDTSKETNCITD